MAKKHIKVYTKLNEIVNNEIFDAIVLNNVIKYIDLDNNKFVIDYEKNTLLKETMESVIEIDFNKNIISILIKDFNKKFYKEIKTLLINHTNNDYYVKYKLIDENIINEYHVEFL